MIKLKLFHSYQYLPNTKSLRFDHNTHTLIDDNNEFLLGLIGIPKIPNINIIIEKYLVTKRFSITSRYRNHTKHNLKIFIEIDELHLHRYLDTIFKYEKTPFINLLKRNYVSYTPNICICDVICILKNTHLNPNKHIQLNTDNIIKIGNKSLDLKSQKIVNKNYTLQKINIHINGGIIQSTRSSSELLYIFNMILGNNNSTNGQLRHLIIVSCLQELKFISFILKKFNFYKSDIDTNIDSKLKLCIFSDLHQLDENISVFDAIIVYKTDILPIKPFIKTNFNGNLWYILDTITIQHAINYINLYKNNIDSSQIPFNLSNIYQLSKLITTITNNNVKYIHSKIKSFYISRKQVNVINSFNSIKYQKVDMEFECSLCLKQTTHSVKSWCIHRYCESCFNDYINQRVIDRTPLECAFCRTSLLNKVIFVSYKNKYLPNLWLKLKNSILPFNEIIICGNNKKINNFLNSLIVFLNPNKIISFITPNDLIVEYGDNSLIICDNTNTTTSNHNIIKHFNSNILSLCIG